jgi:hypothetical protein
MSSGRRPMLLVLPLAWLVVVVVVAAVTWQVIDAAGRQVLGSGSSTPLTAAGSTADAQNALPSGSPSRRPRPADDDSSVAPRTPSAAAGTGVPEDQPGVEPNDGPGAEPSATPSQSPRQQPTQQAPPQAQVRSWQGAAGTVSASCTGATISLQSVTPNDGWGFEVDDRGPQRVRVEFTSRGEEEHETRVEAECLGGEPRFQVENKD